MLELPAVTLCCVDTANHALALRALAKSSEAIRFARVLFLTAAMPEGLAVPAGIDVVTIPPLASRDAYSRFVLKDLLPHIATSHVLLVQWDGFVVNPAAWEPAFLGCDYIGAQWFWHNDGMRVGNGGFSLRSRKLLDALQDTRIELVEAEDTTIGRTFRPLLEREHGIRFADEALADRFAFEAAYPAAAKPFGFHGLYNFCRIVPPGELAALAAQFSDAIASSPQIRALLRNCLALGQWAPAAALARRILDVAAGDAEAAAALAKAEAAIARGTGIGRNDPCPCGSGKKYKHCHGALGASPAPVPATPVVTASLPQASVNVAASPAVTVPLAPVPVAPTTTATAAPAMALPVTPSSPPAAPDADALAARGVAAHRRNELAAAERDYRAALAAVPGASASRLHYLGRRLLSAQPVAAEALPLLERAVARRTRTTPSSTTTSDWLLLRAGSPPQRRSRAIGARSLCSPTMQQRGTTWASRCRRRTTWTARLRVPRSVARTPGSRRRTGTWRWHSFCPATTPRAGVNTNGGFASEQLRRAPRTTPSPLGPVATCTIALCCSPPSRAWATRCRFIRFAQAARRARRARDRARTRGAFRHSCERSGCGGSGRRRGAGART